ncbi:MAG: hypothetical protein JSS12_10410 [Verrucomicrobia bacterium]|nr:hypothetical protein [Verrucomicrobiota bacterium]
MNYVATRIIEREMTKAKGQKYVALVGSGHVSTVKDEQVAGVAELLHVPSVVIEMNKEDKTAMKRNVKDLHDKISHVSLYMQTPLQRWTLPVFYMLGN